jgi:hypothetical protein
MIGTLLVIDLFKYSKTSMLVKVIFIDDSDLIILKIVFNTNNVKQIFYNCQYINNGKACLVRMKCNILNIYCSKQSFHNSHMIFNTRSTVYLIQ